MSKPLNTDETNSTARSVAASSQPSNGSDFFGTNKIDESSEEVASARPAGVPEDETWKTNPGSEQSQIIRDNTLGAFGPYELLQEIAQGGMGIVYKARQTALKRVVALKMILSGQFARKTDVERFKQEAQAAALLDHPNIVPIYEIGECEGRHFFTMAFIEGDSLTAMVGKKGPLPGRDAALMVASVADGVQFAHDHRIIHRDLKPDNVLVDKQGRPRVTDFGLAKQLEGDGILTRPGQVMGTPSFMAPEQARGDRDAVGPPADVYALGGILYFLLTGRPPFNGSTLTDVLYQVAHEPPAPPRQYNSSIPTDLEAICLKCLHKDQAQRYPSAGAVADVLRSWASTQNSSTSTTVRGPVAKPARPPGSTGRVVALASGLTVLLAGIVLLAAYLGGLFGKGESPDPGKLPDNINAQGPGNNVVEPPREIKADGFTIPPKLRNDFKLTASLFPTVEKDGELIIEAETPMKIRLQFQQDAYVGIWSVDAKGTPTRIFPNLYEPNHKLQGGKVYTIPGNTEYTIPAEPSGGLDYLWVVATTQKWDPLAGDDPKEKFAVYEKGKEEWQRQLRGLVIRPTSTSVAPDAVAEVILPFRVVSKK